MDWLRLSEWWVDEVNSDPAYEEVVTPLLLAVLDPSPENSYIDLGCGEGRVMRELAALGVRSHGVDLSEHLISRTDGGVVGDIEELPIRSGAFDGAFSVLTVEHLEDVRPFFQEAARIVVPKGVLAVVLNHPAWTAPGSTPIEDSDGEVLWRPGEYFSSGSSDVRAGDGTVTFHHRPVSALVNAAVDAGWWLEKMVEQPHHELPDQTGIPRLMACRWFLA